MNPASTYFDMLVAFVDEPLVHLVAEAQGVVFDAKVCDGLEFSSAENLAEGVVHCQSNMCRSAESPENRGLPEGPD